MDLEHSDWFGRKRSSLEHLWKKSSKLYMKASVLEFSCVWSWRKIGQGQPKVIIWTILVLLQSQCYISNFKAISPLVPKKKSFKGFYHEQAWRLCWSYDLDCFPSAQGRSICHFVTTCIGQMAFEEIFETVIVWESWVKCQTMTLSSCFHKSLCTH